MTKKYQNTTPDATMVAVPERVSVAMAEIAENMQAWTSPPLWKRRMREAYHAASALQAGSLLSALA